MGAKYTEAQKRATLNHLKYHIADFRVRTTKERKAEIQLRIANTGYTGSFNQFILDAIEEKIARDQK
jgi:hypothetical protein